MISTVKGLPDHFAKDVSGAAKFKAGTDEIDPASLMHLKWVAKLGSQSYGNVTVAGGKVFIGTNNENPRDPRHEGDRSILLCLDEKTGEFLWQLVVPKLASGKVNDWEGLGLTLLADDCGRPRLCDQHAAARSSASTSTAWPTGMTARSRTRPITW